MRTATTNRGIVKISKSVVVVAGAAALAAVLTACSSSGDSQSVSLADLSSPTHSAGSPRSQTPVAQVTPPRITKPAGDRAGTPAPAGQNQTWFPATATTPAPSQVRTTSSVPVPSGPVTFQSAAFPQPRNCAEAGTTYYTPPNVTAALDVTVLVTSPSLAKDLVIVAPNRAPRGLSNASQWISSTAVGNGVWRATYRTFVALYEPKYTPVSFSELQATADGTHYAIEFGSAMTVTLADCKN